MLARTVQLVMQVAVHVQLGLQAQLDVLHAQIVQLVVGLTLVQSLAVNAPQGLSLPLQDLQATLHVLVAAFLLLEVLLASNVNSDNIQTMVSAVWSVQQVRMDQKLVLLLALIVMLVL